MKTQKMIFTILLFFFSSGCCFSQNEGIKKKIYTIVVRKDSMILFSKENNFQLYNAIKDAVGYKDQFDLAQYPMIKVDVYCFLSKKGVLDSVYVKSKNFASKFYEKDVKNVFSQISRIKFKGVSLLNKKMTVVFMIDSWQQEEFNLIGLIEKYDLRNKIRML